VAVAEIARPGLRERDQLGDGFRRNEGLTAITMGNCASVVIAAKSRTVS